MKKKILIIIIILLIIIGGIIILINLNTDENKLKKLGYNDNEIKEISRLSNNEIDTILNNDYSAKLLDIVTNENYDDKNLNNYLAYANNHQKANINDIITIVNKGLTDYEYSSLLGDLANEKYFIKENTERYLKYGGKDASKIVSEVNSNRDYDFYENTKETDITKDNLMIVNKYYYLTEDYEPGDLVTLTGDYNKGVNNMMRREAADAFMEMADAAKLDNIIIRNASAYRNYEYQENLYNNYVTRDGKEAADTYSARAGYSEHQTGLVSDINQIETAFENTDAFRWLSENAYKYGFILRFPKDKENITGYKYEPWHYRYVGKDVAKIIYDEDITLEEYYAYYVDHE